MAKQNVSLKGQATSVIDVVANSMPGRALTTVIDTARSIANSKGGQELMTYFNVGLGEAGSLLVTGHASPIYPGHSSPADLQPSASPDVGSVHGTVENAADKQQECLNHRNNDQVVEHSVAEVGCDHTEQQ